MEQLIKKLTEWIFFCQEKFYEKKYRKHLANIKYSVINSTTKTHTQAGIKLTLNSKTEQNKKKLNDEVKGIVTKNLHTPNALLDYIQENGTRVYKVPFARKLLAFVGEQEGFITPIKGINAFILNIILEKRIAFKTMPMFVISSAGMNIYNMTHQFHKWYGYRMGLPGFDDKAQEKFKKIFDYEIDSNVELLSYEEILSLKEAIHRDIEAIDFVIKLAKENEGAKKAFKNIKDKTDGTNI